MRIKIFLGRTNFNYTDMRTLSLLLVALMACLTGMAQDRGFVHPGGMHSKSDFDRVKAQIANKNPIVLKAFNALEAWGKSNTDTGPGAPKRLSEEARTIRAMLHTGLSWLISMPCFGILRVRKNMPTSQLTSSIHGHVHARG